MLTSLATLLTAAVAAACPNPQFIPHDGAVRVAATDLELPGAHLALKRALTSSLPFSGQLGLGFGLEEELRVEPRAGGALRVIVPGPCPACASAVPEPSPEALMRSVGMAARTLRASGVATLAAEASAYATALAADPGYRKAEWEAHREGWLRAARLEPADGLERLPVAARHRVVALPSGYLRYADPTQVQELDAAGRLVRVVSAAGLVKQLRRDPAGHITRIEDARGHSIAFELDAAGRIMRATGSDGSSASYGYDGAGRMAWSQGKDGRTDYTWGPEETLVGLENDGHSAALSYEPRSAGGRVTDLIDSRAGHERYQYSGKPGGMARSVTVYEVPEPVNREDVVESARDAEEDPAARARVAGPRELRRYAYVEPLTADGRRWTWQETVEEDGQVTATTYDDRTFQPLVVAKGERVARFEYDDLGRVLRKEATGEVTLLTYSPAGKVASVSRRAVGAPAGTPGQLFTYGYDATDRLVTAGSAGSSARIDYDGLGQISVLGLVKDGTTRRLSFAYDEQDRLNRIEVAGLGGITVSYGPDGEIAKADSEGGHAVALEVTSTFQALLELIRPAGVKLDPG